MRLNSAPGEYQVRAELAGFGTRVVAVGVRPGQIQDFNDDRKDAGDMGAGHSVEGDTSALASFVVPDTTEGSSDLGFAAAVAEFGMLLRESELKGTSSFAHARRLAFLSKGDHPNGHRAEFIRLIDAAEGISRLKTASR